MSILFSHFLSQNNEIRPQEADFTEVLASIALAPKMLYFYGKMPKNRVFGVDKKVSSGAAVVDEEAKMAARQLPLAMDSWTETGGSLEKVEGGLKGPGERPKTVAIVGTRKPTKYGEMVAHELAYAVAKRGGVVVSGLAYGIDSIAHRGALEAGGVTVAVLGTPIDEIYPRAHRGLAEEIVKTGGCVMSELPPGVVQGRDYHAKTCFLRRNRLISGLADVVVIPEAAERSGSLNTAAHALEQGREIFALPGDITRPMSRGCNRLIRQGATPYTGVEDVLELLFPIPRRSSKRRVAEISSDTEEETAILRVLAAGVRDGEEILVRAALQAAEFNRVMTMLEIKGRVRALGANKWVMR